MHAPVYIVYKGIVSGRIFSRCCWSAPSRMRKVLVFASALALLAVSAESKSVVSHRNDEEHIIPKGEDKEEKSEDAAFDIQPAASSQ